jgi:hypothetical protein
VVVERLRDDQQLALRGRIDGAIDRTELADDGGAVRSPGVVHEEAPVRCVLGMECEAQQTALAAVRDLLGDVEERGRAHRAIGGDGLDHACLPNGIEDARSGAVTGHEDGREQPGGIRLERHLRGR